MKKLNVMVPVDFSAVSLKAIEFLGLLLEKTPIEIYLVHVVQVNAAEWAGSSESSETIDRAELLAQEQMAEQKFAELKQQVDFNFNYEILHGGLTTSLAKYANQHQIDLVIMGTEGADGWYEKISGSEAQHVVRHTEAPVITIHKNASITAINNILWVADFAAERQPELSITTIKTLQQLYGAQLHLLKIIDKEEESQVPVIKQKMQHFAENLQLQHYEMHLRRDYKVPAGVRNFNRETEMDLVVIGTHARKGIAQVFYGSIAETLVNHCVRPLLTYHLK
jgi:nucleotide-binding universal stress UspA family protein